MVRKVPRKNVDSYKYNNFNKVAKSFFEGAKLAYDFEYYNAAGVLIIHSAIALADSITVKNLEAKCSGDNHYEVIKLLEEALFSEKQNKRANSHLGKLIDHKNIVSYSGDIYYKKDIDKLFKHYDRFANWAKDILE